MSVSPSASAATESAAGAQKAQTTCPHARQWCVEYARAVSLPRTDDVQVTSDPQTEQGTHFSLTLAGASGAGFNYITQQMETAQAEGEACAAARCADPRFTQDWCAAFSHRGCSLASTTYPLQPVLL